MELKSSEILSICYHDIFSYPLNKEDLKRWSPKINFKFNLKSKISYKDGFYFIQKREAILKNRIQNEFYSKKKMVLAKKASNLISTIPSILFVGITGSLAMMNAGKYSDIDLLIITKKYSLWITRLIVYFLLSLNNLKIRKPNTKDEKDKLCLNMWLEEDAIKWMKKDRNIYTAHEILQIIPLINKNNTFEKFVSSNDWIFDFWKKYKKKRNTLKDISGLVVTHNANLFISSLNYIAYLAQLLYMKSKATKEVVSLKKAIFHVNDWGNHIINKLSH